MSILVEINIVKPHITLETLDIASSDLSVKPSNAHQWFKNYKRRGQKSNKEVVSNKVRVFGA